MPTTPVQASEHLKNAIAVIATKIVQSDADIEVSTRNYNHGIYTGSAVLPPIPALNISNTNQVEVRTFVENADSGPTTEDFLNRMNSIVDAAKTLLPETAPASDKEEMKDQLEKLRIYFIREIQSYQLDRAIYGDPLEPRNDKTAHPPGAPLKESYQKLCESREKRRQCRKILNDLPKSKEYKAAESALKIAETIFGGFNAKEADKEPKSQEYTKALKAVKWAEDQLKIQRLSHRNSREYQAALIVYNKADKEYREHRSNYIKEVHGTFQKYAEETIFPTLVEKVRTNESEDPAVTMRRIRDAEIDNTTRQGRPILFNQYPLATRTYDRTPTQHFDMQIPIGYFTDEQAKRLGLPKHSKDTNCCFKRNGEGVSGMVIYASGYVDTQGNCVVENVSPRHTSPVPIEILDDAATRAAITARNATQVAENLARVQLQAEAAMTGRSLADVATDYRDNPLVMNVVENRLLSVHSRLFDNLPGFKDQHQYLQILDTYYAFHMASTGVSTLTIPQSDGNEIAVRVKLNPVVMSIGVNAVRGKLISDDLHDWINTRGFNQLSEEISDTFLPSVQNQTLSENASNLAAILKNLINPTFTPPDDKLANRIKEIKSALKISHEDLEKSFKELHEMINRYETSLKNEPQDVTVINSLRAQIEQKNAGIMQKLEKNHQLEERLISARNELVSTPDRKQQLEEYLNEVRQEVQKARKNPPTVPTEIAKQKATEKLLQMTEGYLEIQSLRNDANYTKAENNYLIQAHLGRLFEQLGYSPASGCNDDKDRGGRYLITRTAIEKFINQFGYVPKHTNQQDMRELSKYISELDPCSSNLWASELTAVKGARGFQLFKGDGNWMFRLENSVLAKFGKAIYPKLGKRPVAQAEAKQAAQPQPTARKSSDLQMEGLDEWYITNRDLPSSPSSSTVSLDPNKISSTFEDFAKINLHSMLMRNEKLAEALLIKHWNNIKWFESAENNAAFKKSCEGEKGQLDPRKLSNAIQVLRTRYDAVYREGISQIVNLYANNPKLVDSLIIESHHRTSADNLEGSKPPLSKHATKEDVETLRRVFAIQQMNKDVNEAATLEKAGKPSLLNSANWESRSYVHGAHLAFKFWGTERSPEVQKMDALIERYQKTSSTGEKGPILLELASVIKAWNTSHQNLHKTSRRASAVEELHTEVIRELNELNKSQNSASTRNLGSSPSSQS